MRTNNRYLNEFLLDIRNQENKADNTIASYESDLIEMLQYMKKIKTISGKEVGEISIDDITKELLQSIEYNDLTMFINYLKEDKNNKDSSRSRKVAPIKRFFAYLLEMNYISINPALRLKTPKLDKNLPVYLTLEEAQKLLQCIKGENKERDFAIITLLLNDGLRRSELKDIDINKIKGDILTVKGKGSKERTVYLNEACLKAIEEYLKVRPNINDNALFLSEQKRRMSNKTIHNVIKKHLKEAGLDTEKYSIHKLRHTAATLMYKYGKVDIRSLQEILGHENLSTTQIYTHIDDETLRVAVNSNPLNIKG